MNNTKLNVYKKVLPEVCVKSLIMPKSLLEIKLNTFVVMENHQWKR